MKYQNQEINSIVFLLKLHNFVPNDIYYIKTEQKKIKLTNKQVSEWSKITGMGNNMMKIWKYKLSVKSKDVMKLGFKGKDIGDKMKELETQKFLGK